MIYLSEILEMQKWTIFFCWQPMYKTQKNSGCLVSDIAIFVLKRDVKLQLTN